MKSKGIALVLVLGFIMVAVLAANIALRLISGHSLLARHKAGRIQAFYAAQAGINYALEQLRTGAWTLNPPAGSDKHYCINDDGVTMNCADGNPLGNIVDGDILFGVEITIGPENSGIVLGTTQLQAKVEY